MQGRRMWRQIWSGGFFCNSDAEATAPLAGITGKKTKGGKTIDKTIDQNRRARGRKRNECWEKQYHDNRKHYLSQIFEITVTPINTEIY